MGRTVVITGMGVVSSLGDRPADIVQSIQQDRVAFQYAASDPRLVVAPVSNFDVRAHTGRHKNLRYLNRGAAMGVAAAVRAAQHAGLSPEHCQGAGVFMGVGPNLDVGGECPDIAQGRITADPLAALWLLRFLPNTAASTVSQLLGCHGDNATVGTACAASLQAVGEAFRKIKHGYLDVALAGGGDSRLSAGALLAYQKAGALYNGSHAPPDASRPFDEQRHGFVPGEGGACVVLESAEHAHARQASALAEICGYSATMDGYAMTAPRPDGRWAEVAVRSALKEAHLDAEEVKMISAHGTGTALNDGVEAALIQEVFGRHGPKVLALKSWVGHLASACGAMELALCLIARKSGVWPLIRNLDFPCNTALDYIRDPEEGTDGPLVIQNFGFGGQNAVLVIR